MEPIFNTNKLVKMNYTNLFKSKNKQSTIKANKSIKSNNLIKIHETKHHPKLYNINLIIANNLFVIIISINVNAINISIFHIFWHLLIFLKDYLLYFLQLI